MASTDKESLLEYHALFVASLDAIMVTKSDGTILAANPAACRLLGRSEEEIRRVGRWGTVNRHDPDVIDALETRSRTGSFQGELTFYRKNGESFPAEVSTASFVGEDGVGRNVMVFRDITERKKSAEALKQSEDKFGRLFYTSPDGITVTRRADGRYLEINPGFTVMSGYEAREVLGLTPVELGIWTNQAQRDRFVRELQENGEVINSEFEFRFKGGRLRTCLVSARPVVIGGVDCILSTTRDVTQKKHLEETLLRTQKLDSIGLLAGGIAHDFNNMLGGLLGFLDLAQEMNRQGKHDRTAAYLEKALAIFPRARGLTHQLLTFSKGGDPVRRTLELGPLVHNSVAFALSGSNVVGEFALPEDLWPCDCDDTQIGQAIDNLVLNAVQAMPLGGVLKVSARNLTRVLGHPGRYVEVSIADEGPGIEPDNLTKIFDPFFTTKATGHGLGLAMVFSIVRKHDGWVDVTSTPGHGATFHLFLPASQHKVAAERTLAQGGDHQGSGAFLVLDDNETLLEVTDHWLTSMGYHVVLCRDGADAVERIEAAQREGTPFRAALLDLTIPGKLGGLDAARFLKASCPDVVLIASSGYSEDPIVARPEAYGFSGKIVKPFQRKDLDLLLLSIFGL